MLVFVGNVVFFYYFRKSLVRDKIVRGDVGGLVKSLLEYYKEIYISIFFVLVEKFKFF